MSIPQVSFNHVDVTFCKNASKIKIQEIDIDIDMAATMEKINSSVFFSSLENAGCEFKVKIKSTANNLSDTSTDTALFVFKLFQTFKDRSTAILAPNGEIKCDEYTVKQKLTVPIANSIFEEGKRYKLVAFQRGDYTLYRCKVAVGLR